MSISYNRPYSMQINSIHNHPPLAYINLVPPPAVHAQDF